MSRRRLAVADIGRSATVLLLVDFINPLDFEGAQSLRGPALQAALATARLRRRLAREAVACVYANDNYGIWRSDFQQLWNGCRAVVGEPGRIARALKPRRADFTILKPRHSAFYNTPLELLLSQLRCRRLVVTGLAADNCVLFTAMDAYLRGYSLWVPPDCTAAESVSAKAEALALMQRTLKADVRAAFG